VTRRVSGDGGAIEAQLRAAQAELAPGDPFIALTLNGRTPAQVASDLVSGTRVGDVAFHLGHALHAVHACTFLFADVLADAGHEPVACLLLLAAHFAVAAQPASSIPAARLVQPADWAAKVKDGSAAETLTLHVGFKTMFDQAHIPGSEYAGPGNTGAGLQVLRDRVAGMARNAPILIYCGLLPLGALPQHGRRT
jgi:hypothetical protein